MDLQEVLKTNYCIILTQRLPDAFYLKAFLLDVQVSNAPKYEMKHVTMSTNCSLLQGIVAF